MKRDASEAVIGCKPMISSSSDGVMSRAPYFMLKCVNGQWDPPSVKCSSTVAFDGESVSAGGGASASAAAASAHGPHPPGPPAGGFISASRFANSGIYFVSNWCACCLNISTNNMATLPRPARCF